VSELAFSKRWSKVRES